MPNDSTHECPGPDCKVRVSRSQLACRRHWYQVPLEIRRWVWSAYRSGSDDHVAAMTAAIDSMH